MGWRASQTSESRSPGGSRSRLATPLPGGSASACCRPRFSSTSWRQRGPSPVRNISQPPGRRDRRRQKLEKQQGPDEEGHCSGDGRTAAGSGPCWLAASGTRYILYPGEFVPQPVGRVKRLSTFALNSTRRSHRMSRKNRRSQLRKPQRGSSGGGRAARPAGIPPPPAPHPGPSGPSPQPPQPVQVPPTAAAKPVPVARPLTRGPRGREQAGPLPTQDATIPKDRVASFRLDLRRIAITAGLMFVLLIAGSIVLRSLLQA